MNNIAEEFKKFATRGNMVDMAIGIIVGGAFGRVVNSLVSDIVMPPIGLLLGGVDFSDLYINLSSETYGSLTEAQAAGAATINYGSFMDNAMSFLVIAASVFLMIKFINKLRQEEPKPKPATKEKECPYCLNNINIRASRCPNCTSLLDK
jgi:large conductance mechanosensitive channel